MKALIIGVSGQLGMSLLETKPSSVEVVGGNIDQPDIRHLEDVLHFSDLVTPDVIINSAAYTAVDRAEEEASNAFAVNAQGAENVARAARNSGARLVHMSTDFVFDGKSTAPYGPTSKPNPLSVYGRSKLDGELAVEAHGGDNATIVRTSWLYSQYGSNFVKTMLSLMASRSSLSVVADQVGTPTWADGLAKVVWSLAGSVPQSRTYHWSDEGQASWYEFALAIQKEAFGLGVLDKIIPIRAISSAEFAAAADRPKYSVLDATEICSELGLEQKPWRSNLKEMLNRVIL